MTRTPRAPATPDGRELYRRYDLSVTLAEAQADLAPENEQRRLLKQSEIAARFRKRTRLHSTGTK